MDPWEQVARLARLQHGVVSRRQVEEAGLSPRVLTERVRFAGWQRPYPSVYALPGTADTHERHVASALLACGPPALVTGNSAAHVLGISHGRPDAVELLIPATRSVQRQPGLHIIRTTTFETVGARRTNGFPIAPIPRALIDAARRANARSLAVLIANADRRRLTTLDAVALELQRRERFPGRGRVREALRILEKELSHSAGEALARRHLREAGINPHPAPYSVVHQGQIIAEIDIAFPWCLYGVEIDGPHHLLTDQARYDKARDRRLRRIGWVIDRFATEDVEQCPELFVREVAARLRMLENGCMTP